jgi:peptidoglycan/xylan/chitin deacetylase (PgdA/CDA1 family)
MITVNFDAEVFWLRLDPSTAARPKTRSIGEYAAARGADRILEALDRHHVIASWFLPAAVANRYATVCRRVADHGHEIAFRGEALERLNELGKVHQREILGRALHDVSRVAAAPVVGFRTFDDMTTDTVEVLCDLGVRWCSCTRGDDRPFFFESRNGLTQLVDIPFQWSCQDAPYLLFNYAPAYPPGQCRIAAYSDVLDNWTAEFDAYRDEQLCFVLTLDPQVIGRPGRIGLVSELLTHMRSTGDVWFATGLQIADFWLHAAVPNPPGNSESVRLTIEGAGA